MLHVEFELYKILPNKEDVIKGYELLLKRQEKVLGRRHLDCLRTMHEIARMHRRMGRPEEALPWLHRMAEPLRRLMGDLHDEVNDLRSEMASCYTSIGRADLAVRHAQVAYENEADKLIAERPNRALQFERKLVRTLLAAEDFANAQGHLMSARTLRRKESSNLDDDEAEACLNLSQCYIGQGKYKNAMPFLSVLNDRRMQSLRLRNRTEELVLEAILGLGEDAQIGRLLDALLKDRRNRYKGEPTKRAQMLESLARLLMKYDRHSMAVSVQREVVQLRESASERSWRLSLSRSRLGIALLQQTEGADGGELLKQGCDELLTQQSRVPISENEFLIVAIDHLVRHLHDVGNEDEENKYREVLTAVRATNEVTREKFNRLSLSSVY